MRRAGLVLFAVVAASCGTGSNSALDETPVLAVASHLLRDDAVAAAKIIPVCVGEDVRYSPSPETFAALRALDDRITACRAPDTTPNVVYLRIRTVTKREPNRYVVRAGLYCAPDKTTREDCTDDGDFVVSNVGGTWQLVPHRGLAY